MRTLWQRIKARVALWRKQAACPHSFTPVGMIEWQCEHCGYETDNPTY